MLSLFLLLLLDRNTKVGNDKEMKSPNGVFVDGSSRMDRFNYSGGESTTSAYGSTL